MGDDAWDVAEAYEAYIGRWSRPVAVEFLRLLPWRPGDAWCDVGCGTGALAHAVLAAAAPSRVLGVEPSAAFAAAAETGDPRLTVIAGTATSVPSPDDAFDHVVSALALNFVPDPHAAVAEMIRVARPGGAVAGYVWDYAEGMGVIRAFWDAARAVDPAAAELDEGVRFPLCRPEPLVALLDGAGLGGPAVDAVEVPTVFADPDDLWRPFLGGQGPAPGYCAGLTEERRAALRKALEERLPHDDAGRIPLTARAWAFRGTVPGDAEA